MHRVVTSRVEFGLIAVSSRRRLAAADCFQWERWHRSHAEHYPSRQRCLPRHHRRSVGPRRRWRCRSRSPGSGRPLAAAAASTAGCRWPYCRRNRNPSRLGCPPSTRAATAATLARPDRRAPVQKRSARFIKQAYTRAQNFTLIIIRIITRSIIVSEMTESLHRHYRRFGRKK